MFSKHTESGFLAGVSISLVPSELICLKSMNNCMIMNIMDSPNLGRAQPVEDCTGWSLGLHSRFCCNDGHGELGRSLHFRERKEVARFARG